VELITELRLDPVACTGHGLCADLLPELVELDEWGFPILRGGAVGPGLLAHARRAVSACPTLALRLVKTPADHDPSHRWA
jgi:ferredoxin